MTNPGPPLEPDDVPAAPPPPRFDVPPPATPSPSFAGPPQFPTGPPEFPVDPPQFPADPSQYPAGPPQYATGPAQYPAGPPQYVPGPPPPGGVPPYGTPGVGYPVAPARQGSNRALIITIVSIAAAVVVLPVIALITVWLVVAGQPTGGGAPVPAPTSSPIAEPADPTPTAVPDLPGGGSVEAQLEALFDKYLAARNDGSLWQQIPDTEFNRTAVVAFLYLITDLKGAAAFGADTSDYMDRAAELERKLLAEEPLGTDISIKGSERTFTYDGETGAGGYTDN